MSLVPPLPKPSFADTVRILDECVAERGADYVYSKPADSPIPKWTAACLYMHSASEPGCIIGLMLVKMGLDPEWLWNHNTEGINMKYPEIFGSRPDTYNQEMAFKYMITVQVAQDTQEISWGDAVSRAKAEFSEYL